MPIFNLPRTMQRPGGQGWKAPAQITVGLVAVLSVFWGLGMVWSSARALRAQQAVGETGRSPQPSTLVPMWPNQQVAGPIIRSQTNVVLVDVRVWDKSGHPVADLTQDDFRVFEDGKPQKVTSFSFENVERLAKASAESGPPQTIDLANLPPDVPPAEVLQDHRLLVLFFDLTSMPVGDLMRAITAAMDFVHTRMTPADLVAVVTYTSNLRVIQDFTNDRDALSKAFRSLHVGESSSLSQVGAEGEAGTTNASGDEVVNQDVSAAFTPDETEFNIFNTDEKLAAIESLARMLRGVPGRKSVIHFSSGVERTGIENQAQLRATVDSANQANVSLYTIDARGLTALPPGGDASASSPVGTALYTGQAVRAQISTLQGGRETLAALATETGGRAFYDSNDFAPAFREVQTENSTYYLLGYSPSDTRSDGRFRRIRVEVDRPGMKIKARPGYFAPKDFRQFAREDKELQLQQAMDLDTPFVDLPMAVEAASFRRPNNKFFIVLAAKIPGSSISFLKRSATHQTEFDFAWRATDSSGGTVAALRDTLPVKLSEQTYEQVSNGNILYEGGIELPPGIFRLKVVVRENRSGNLGTFEQPLVLPEVGDAGLALSSVVVSNQMQAASETPLGRKGEVKTPAEDPLRMGDRRVLPSVTRVFRTTQNLCVYLESYGTEAASRRKANTDGLIVASKDATSSLPPSIALVFFRGGVKVFEAGPFSGSRTQLSGETTSYFVQIPLAKFPPGRYWMQVNVLDPSADRVAFARVPLAILRMPGTSPGARVGR